MKKHLICLLTALAIAGCTAKGRPPTAPAPPTATYEYTPFVNPTWESIRTVVHAGGPLEESIKTPPSDPRMAYRLGAALEQSGLLDKARTYYAEALKLFPDDPDLKRAAAALAGDFTMDGVPDRIVAEGVFLYFYDGTKPDWILQLQPFTGETKLKTELVDIGGPRPAIIITSPKGAHVEFYRGDGFTGYGGGETAEYSPAGRELILTRASTGTAEPMPKGYLRFRTEADGNASVNLSPTPHPAP